MNIREKKALLNLELGELTLLLKEVKEPRHQGFVQDLGDPTVFTDMEQWVIQNTGASPTKRMQIYVSHSQLLLIWRASEYGQLANLANFRRYVQAKLENFNK